MSRDPKKMGKRDKAEIETGADLLLYPGRGGIAVWVRRDEVLPRSAIRWREPGQTGGEIDLTEAVMMIAALNLGVAKTAEAVARLFDIDANTFVGMVEEAIRVIGPRMDAMTETKSGEALKPREDRGGHDAGEGQG